MSRNSVETAPSGWLGFDTDTALTATTAAAFAAAGFHFAVCCLSNGAGSSGGLTSSEVRAILSAGLALSATQRVSSSGWQPTLKLGEENGAAAAQNAESAGLVPGMNIWLDLEGASSSASTSDVSAYCNAWFAQVSAAKYVPGLYVGAGSILNADELDALNVKYFRKSAGNVPYPSIGHCMVQSVSSSYVIDGVAYDRDVVQKDNLEHTPLMMTGARPATMLTESIVEPSGSSKSSIFKWVGALVAGVAAYAGGVYTGPIVLPAAPSPRTSTATAPATTSAPAQTHAAPEPVPTDPKGAEPSGQNLLVASFLKRETAEHLAMTLRQAGYSNPDVSEMPGGGREWYVVRVGPYPTRTDAEKAAGQMRQEYGLDATVSR